MQIIRIICDHCHREAQEDDADEWLDAPAGRDLCPQCQGDLT